jgi:hypothetical protein
LAGKPEGKTALRERRCKGENNTKMDLIEVWYDGVYQTLLSLQNVRWQFLVNKVINIWFP